MSFHHPRPELAATIAARLSTDPILGAQAGLFLAAPRRTGKSTFLRRDLIPALEAGGRFCIYVDLWSNRKAEPAQLIADALVRALSRLETSREKLLAALPFSAIGIGAITVELAPRAGGATGTAADLVAEIGRRAGRDIVLVVDEAQDALNTEAGRDAMFALKAARDHMNQTADLPALFLLFTGSNRDKLSDLVMKSDQAFYGGTLTDFPPLGRDYAEALVSAINPRLAEDNRLDADDVADAFALLGHRPELLQEVIKDYASGLGTGDALKRRVPLREQADALKARQWRELKITHDALTDLQKAVLLRLACDGGDFSPYAEPTLDRLGATLGREIGSSDVQKALKALRDDHLVWHRARGLYLIEDHDMRDWLLHQFDC